MTEIVRCGAGYRQDINGWICLHIEGDATERGFQHGYLVAKELEEIKRCMKFLTYHDTGKTWEFFVSSAEALHAPRLTTELLFEIKGIANGAQEQGVDITWQEVLLWNAYEELTDYWWPNAKPALGYAPSFPVQRDQCSAFIAREGATEDGKIVMAHNSFDNFEHGQFSNVILDIQPSAGHRMFMQSSPGYIDSFADFFITDAGIVGTETTIGGFGLYDTSGIPEYMRIRRAMQYGNTLDDYVAIMLDGNNGGYANSWLFGDIRNNSIMRFELGLRCWGVERDPECNYFIGFNAPLNPEIRNLECTNTGYCDIRRHQGARQVRLEQLMKLHFGKINCEIGKEILADHHDVYLEQQRVEDDPNYSLRGCDHPTHKFNNPSSRTVDGHYELDPRTSMSQIGRPEPYRPRGAVDGKVTDSELASKMGFHARWGNSSGMDFKADEHIDKHPQWEYLRDYLKDRLSQPWTLVAATQSPTE